MTNRSTVEQVIERYTSIYHRHLSRWQLFGDSASYAQAMDAAGTLRYLAANATDPSARQQYADAAENLPAPVGGNV